MRAILKVGRWLVCVLLMLVACTSAVWGDQFRRKAGGGNSWWQDWQISLDNGTTWTDQYTPPDNGDTFIITEDTTLDLMELNNSQGYFSITIMSTVTPPPTLTVTGTINLAGNLSATSLVKLTVDGVNIVCNTLNINPSEAPGTVEININSHIDVLHNLNIGASSGDGDRNTSTKFSGTGSITAHAMDFPGQHDHSVELGDDFTISFETFPGEHYEDYEIAALHADGSGTVSITGNGTIDFDGATVNTGGSTTSLDIDPAVNVQNDPANPNPTWRGTSSSDWNTLANWSGLSDLADLASKDITIETYTNAPEISGDTAVKSLTIKSGATVTQTGGTLTTESLACEGTGTFTATGGTVSFNGDDSALTLSTNSYLYDASIAAGKQLTLSSALTFKGDLDVSGGTLVTAGNSVVFNGEGSESSPLSLTPGINALDTLQVKSGYLSLAGDLTAASVNLGSNSVLILGADLTISGTLENKGKVSVSSHTIQIGKYSHQYVSTDELIFSGGTLVYAGSTGDIFDHITLNGDATFTNNGTSALTINNIDAVNSATLTINGTGSTPTVKNVTLNSGKTLTLGSDLSVSTSLTNNGSIILAGKNLTCASYSGSSDSISLSGTVGLNVTSGTVSEVTVMDSATLSGTFSCGKLSAASLGGKTLTLNGYVTVGSGTATDTLSLSGSSAASKLTVDGSGIIYLNSTQAGGTWLSVGSGPVISVSGGGAYTTTYSTGPASPATVPSGWNICENGLVYVWTGAAGSSTWNTAGNWSVGMVPSGTSDDVEIPAGLTRYPVTPSSQLSINSLTVEDGASVTVADGNKLRFVSYSGDGVIKLGTGNIEVRSAGTSCTIKNIEFTGTGTRSFADISKVTLVNLKVPSGKTLQLSAGLTLTGEMDNAGTINTNGKTLTFKTYTGAGTVQIGTAGNVAVGSSGTGGTIQNVVFAGTRGYVAPANITFTDGTINSGVTLTVNTNLLSFAGDLINKGSITLSSAGLTVSGNIDNQGTVNCNNRPFSFASYSNSRAGTVTDKILTNGIGGSVTCTGSGTGSGAVTYAELNGSSGVTNSGTGALTFTKAIVSASGSSLTLTNSGSGSIAFGEIQVSANATLTPGSAVISKLSVNNTTTTLTLNDALSVTGTLSNSGTLNASGGALSAGTLTNAGTLNATGGALSATTLTNTGTLNSTGGALTVTGSLTNSGSVTSSGGALSVTGTLTNQSGGTVRCNDFDLTAGTLANSGSVSLTAATGGSSITCTTYTPSGSGSMTLSGDVTLDVGTNRVGTINYSNGALTAGASGLKAGTLNVTAGPAELACTGSSGIDLTTLSVAGSTTVSGTVNVSGNLTATAALTLSGTVNVTGTVSASADTSVAPTGFLTAGSVTITGGSHTIYGAVSAGTYSAKNLGNKTFIVNGTLRVTTEGSAETAALALEGTATSATTGTRLSVSGSGTININGSQIGGKWLSVSTSGPAIQDLSGTDSVIYTATYSVPSGGTATEFNGWYLCDADLVYKWKGTTSNQWNVAANWSVRSVPGTSSKVEIPATGNDPVTPVPVTIGSLSVASSVTLTMGGNFTVSGEVANNGTIDTNGRTLKFATYTKEAAGNDCVVIGSAGGLATPTGSGGTISNIEFKANRNGLNGSESGFAGITGIEFINGKIDDGKELFFTGMSFSDSLENGGTLHLNDTLTCSSYSGNSTNADTVILGENGVVTASSGTIGTLEFAANRSYTAVSGLTYKNGQVDENKSVTFASDIAFTEALSNAGTINLTGHNLTAKAYAGSGGYIISGNVTITSTGSGEAASGAVEKITSNGVTAFTQTGAYIIKNLVAGSSASDTAALTLAANTTVVNLTIMDKATVYAGPDATSTKTLTVRGDFINRNTTSCTPENPVYNGFVPQKGTVVIEGTGNTSVRVEGVAITAHKISGNIKFYNFTCTTDGAVIAFDAKAVINVDHQIDVEGTPSELVHLTIDDDTVTSDSDKWTLDLIWDVEAGTIEHPRPIIQYVRPHKSSSFSAILKGCLVGCEDDANDLHDSTNVNWFDDMPTILMTAAPVGGNQLFVLFSTEVSAAPLKDLRTAVALTSSTVTNLIDPAVPVTLYTGTSDKSKTGVVFGLTRNLTWDDLFGSDCMHVEIVEASAVRVGSTRISYLSGVKHGSSDFAVNAARMLFGYDNFIDSSTPLTIEKGVNSVRTWDQSDPVSNRLHAESDLLFQAQLEASVPTGLKLNMIAQFTSQLNAGAIGDNFASYYNLDTRLWLPTVFLPLSTLNQTVPSAQQIVQDSTSSGRLRNFSLTYNKSSSYPLFKMSDGEEIQFLFKFMNADDTELQVVHDYDYSNGTYTPVYGPLYAIRLVDDSDITSFDLWSVMLQSTTTQRGSVTILNNVINADQREKTFVTIEMQKAGSLTVQVLTLDGSVITTLERGRKQAGTYGYDWDGTNGKGKPVARGMYFIRVIGPDIDETRKVMVVRD